MVAGDQRFSGEAPQHSPKWKLKQKNVILIVSWSAASLIYHSFLNLDETITLETYAQQTGEKQLKLQQLRHVIQQKRTNLSPQERVTTCSINDNVTVEQAGLRDPMSSTSFAYQLPFL